VNICLDFITQITQELSEQPPTVIEEEKEPEIAPNLMHILPSNNSSSMLNRSLISSDGNITISSASITMANKLRHMTNYRRSRADRAETNKKDISARFQFRQNPVPGFFGSIMENPVN
jgi:hypothetical protein